MYLRKETYSYGLMCSGPAEAQVFWSSPLKAIPREESGKITDGVKCGGDKRVGGVRLLPGRSARTEKGGGGRRGHPEERMYPDFVVNIPDLIRILK